VGEVKFGGETALRQTINLPAAKVPFLKSLLSDIDNNNGCCSLLSPLSKIRGSELIPCAVVKQVGWFEM
jgi:hypothetical protein